MWSIGVTDKGKKMRALALTVVGILFLQLTLPDNARGGELSERAAITATVAKLFRNQRFSELEALSAGYRESRSRTSSGIWHLSLFYVGTSLVFDSRERNPTFWREAARATKKWMTEYPYSPTAHLVYAKMLLKHGWAFRGTGRADAVKPEDWAPFHYYVENARIYLEENKNVGSKDPHWYELMEVIAYVQSWPESRFVQLVEEALQREPHFYQIYFAALDYYAPKWGGSSTAIEQFARKALERTRRTEGYGLYARIYWYASETQYGYSIFTESLVNWPTMKKGIDDVLKRYPDAWNLNNFARFACLARDKAKTAELLARIGPVPYFPAWSPHVLYQQCKNWSLR